MSQDDNGQFDRISDVGYVTGCSLLAGRGAIDAVGLIPEEYFLYFEETDWNVAAQRKGYRTVIAPSSLVWHKYDESGDYKDRFIYYSFRNRVRIVWKYSPRHIFKAVQVNLSLLDRYVSMAPERAILLRFICFLAHLDAFLARSGKAKWSIIN
jgi:GT2 family glycosyltransferase